MTRNRHRGSLLFAAFGVLGLFTVLSGPAMANPDATAAVGSVSSGDATARIGSTGSGCSTATLDSTASGGCPLPPTTVAQTGSTQSVSTATAAAATQAATARTARALALTGASTQSMTVAAIVLVAIGAAIIATTWRRPAGAGESVP